MADHEILKKIELLKNTRISVFVDEALPDILVVTYEFGVQIFKGVLLDSTKRNLPYGINQLNPAFKNPSPPTKPKLDDDQLYTVNQRYAYTDPNLTKKKNVQISTKYKNNKMTVRLRPRQVLCSKCKGICTENSENVSRKRKTSETSTSMPTTNSTSTGTTTITIAQTTMTTNQPAVKRSLNAPITRSVYSEMNNGKKLSEATLVPKLTRLTPEEELSILNNSNRNLNDEQKKALTVTNNKENTQQDNKNKKHSIEHSDESSNPDDIITNKSVKRILRKKRSVGSMEDLWDESVFEENTNKNNQQQDEHNPSNLTRTIKISYGPQGEGTVLKIPALNVNNNSEENIEIDNNNDDDNEDGGGGGGDNIDNEKQIDDKAVRRALKKAKKEARRKIFVSNSSPHYLTSNSPRYTIGGSSPRYTVGSASPRHGLGNNSPRYMCASTYDLKVPRRRKHKVKHKKKHKEDRDKKYKDNDIVSSTQSDDAKEQYVTQKLSINLKRLNNTYASFPATSSSSTTTTIQSNKIDENTSSSDEHSEQVPDFPPPNSPLMLRINSQTLPSVPTADGGRMLVGDVVWGKIHGFPWWPGKVLTITNCGSQGPQAHVAWYGSSTSSLMQCDQLSPYLENFKIRYNKKKRGPYKEAIRQATLEAKENAEIKMRQPLGNSPQHKIITQVVPPALASPREIDVVS